MSCINCDDCETATPLIPECSASVIRIGTYTGAGNIIVRMTNTASEAQREAVITPGVMDEVDVQLSDFGTDLSFWQSSQGYYAINWVLESDGSPVAILNYDDNAITANCLLIRFVPNDNVTGMITLGFS